MSNVLEELVQKVAYMFYDNERTMVLIGLLEIGQQVNLDELSSSLKFRKKDLSKTLAILQQDGLIRINQQEDLEGVEDYDNLTKAQKNKLMKDYYSIDFKSFVDSVHLKILLGRDRLQKNKGPEDLIYYQCPKCQATISLRDYLSEFPELANQGIICPDCEVKLIELDDSNELNQKKKLYNDFVELTQPLLDLIHQTDGLVMINDPEELCKSDKMISREQYEDEKEKIRQRIEIQKRTRHIGQSSGQNPILDPVNKTNVIVLPDDDKKPVEQDIGHLKDLVKQEKDDLSQDKSKKATITLNGKEYTVDDLTDEFLETLDPQLYDQAMNFIDANK